MAYEVIKEIKNAHEDSICCIAYDRAKKAVYTVAEGDRAIKVGKECKICENSPQLRLDACTGGTCVREQAARAARTVDAPPRLPPHSMQLHAGPRPHPTGMGPQDRRAAARADRASGRGDRRGVCTLRAPALLGICRRRRRRLDGQGRPAAGEPCAHAGLHAPAQGRAHECLHACMQRGRFGQHVGGSGHASPCLVARGAPPCNPQP